MNRMTGCKTRKQDETQNNRVPYGKATVGGIIDDTRRL